MSATGKICMVGCLESGLDIAEHLIKQGIRISHFVTISPEQAQRSRVSGYVDVTDFCAQHDIVVYRAHRYDMKCEEDERFFAEQKFDLLLIGGWTRLIQPNVLAQLRIGGLGAHGSPNFLPVGRGRSPLNWAIINGQKRMLLHLFKLAPGVDDGDIVAVQQFDVNAFDTIRTLNYKYAIAVKRLYEQYIPRLLAGDVRFIQQVGEPEFFPKRAPEDGLIHFQQWNVERIHDFVRALTKPYPGAFTHYEGQKVFFWKAQVFDTSLHYPTAAFGEIVEVFRSDLVVNCRDGLLLVSEIEPALPYRIGGVFQASVEQGASEPKA